MEDQIIGQKICKNQKLRLFFYRIFRDPVRGVRLSYS
jgi:hypothetical protein